MGAGASESVGRGIFLICTSAVDQPLGSCLAWVSRAMVVHGSYGGGAGQRMVFYLFLSNVGVSAEAWRLPFEETKNGAIDACPSTVYS